MYTVGKDGARVSMAILIVVGWGSLEPTYVTRMLKVQKPESVDSTSWMC